MVAYCRSVQHPGQEMSLEYEIILLVIKYPSRRSVVTDLPGGKKGKWSLKQQFNGQNDHWAHAEGQLLKSKV